MYSRNVTFKKHIANSLKLGLSSALLSFISFYFSFLIPPLIAAPGLIFGLALYQYYGNKKTSKLIAFITISTIAYFTAYSIARELAFLNFLEYDQTRQVSEIYTDYLSYLLAGIVGGELLTFGFSFFLKRLNLVQIALSVGASALITIIWLIFLSPVRGSVILWALSIFILWQIGMSYIYGYFVWKNEH